MRKLFIQEKQDKDGYCLESRINPYNPLNYMLIIIAFCVMVLMFGLYGVWKQVFNPFEWQS